MDISPILMSVSDMTHEPLIARPAQLMDVAHLPSTCVSECALCVVGGPDIIQYSASLRAGAVCILGRMAWAGLEAVVSDICMFLA